MATKNAATPPRGEFQPVRDPRTQRLLFRYNPTTQQVEVGARGKVVVVDLGAYHKDKQRGR